jgi:hypothetical protein
MKIMDIIENMNYNYEMINERERVDVHVPLTQIIYDNPNLSNEAKENASLWVGLSKERMAQKMSESYKPIIPEKEINITL